MKRTIVIIASLVVFLYASCDKKPKLGKYVYIDRSNTLHTDSKCDAIFCIKGAYPVNFIPIERVSTEDWNNTCSKCVSDAMYDKIVQNAEINDADRYDY